MGRRALAPATVALVLAFAAQACGGGSAGNPPHAAAAPSVVTPPASLSGQVWTEGSSELTGLLIAASERFRRAHSGVEVVVGLSGEDRGMQRLCRAEVDLAVLSRPLPASEIRACAEDGVQIVRLAARAGTFVVYTRARALQRPEVRAFAEYVAGGERIPTDTRSPHLHEKDT